MRALLQKLRLECAYSHHEIAERVGISPGMYNCFETGQKRPTKEIFLKLKKLALKHLSKNDLLMFNQYEEQLFGHYAKVFSEYQYLDVEHFIVDFPKLQGLKQQIENDN